MITNPTFSPPYHMTCLCGCGYRCADIDECSESLGICGGGDCTNLPGSYRCKCVGGLRSSRDRKNCEGIALVEGAPT